MVLTGGTISLGGGGGGGGGGPKFSITFPDEFGPQGIISGGTKFSVTDICMRSETSRRDTRAKPIQRFSGCLSDSVPVSSTHARLYNIISHKIFELRTLTRLKIAGRFKLCLALDTELKCLFPFQLTFVGEWCGSTSLTNSVPWR